MKTESTTRFSQVAWRQVTWLQRVLPRGLAASAALTAVAASLSACTPLVLEPLDDPPEHGLSAIAMPISNYVPSSGILSGYPGPNVGPDATILIFSNGGHSCQQHDAAMGCELAPIWQFSMAVPPALLQPGQLLNLTTGEVGTHARFMLFPSSDGSECSMGAKGGQLYEGTAEIVSVTPTTIEVVLTDVGQKFGDGAPELVMDGHYVAERCSP